MGYTVYMKSDVYGCETFPRDTLEEALETIKNLTQKAEELDDGIERDIGMVVGELENDEDDPDDDEELIENIIWPMDE